MAHDGRIADPRRIVQPDPARSCRDRQQTPISPGTGSAGRDLLVERCARILSGPLISHGGGEHQKPWGSSGCGNSRLTRGFQFGGCPAVSLARQGNNTLFNRSVFGGLWPAG
jgi:hypothetical protein